MISEEGLSAGEKSMGYFHEELLRELCILPCQKRYECPYIYDRNTDRDIEGMPFIAEDPRSCPKCGHICPEFMEAFGLSPQDLEIRALIHCGGLLDLLADLGEIERTSLEFRRFKEKYRETVEKYPAAEFPQFYWCLLHPLNQHASPSLS